MSVATVALKRNKEVYTALIYCCILALSEIALYVIQKSSLRQVLPALLSEIDVRLIFLPCAALIALMRDEKRTAFIFSLLYAVGAVALSVLGLAGVISGVKWMQVLVPVVKAVVLLIACKSGAKAVRIALIAVYAACELLNLYTLYTVWGVAAVALFVLLIPAIILWVKGLQPDMDIYTGLYNVSSVYSMQRLLCIAASFVCGFLFMVLAISLLGSYADLFTATGVYTILISCVLSWLFAFLLLNMAD